MTRPPLMRMDMRIPPLGSRGLLPARAHGDVCLLPVVAVHVDAVVLGHLDPCLREVVAEGLFRGGLLDHLEVESDLGRSLERLLVHDADPLGRRPDERVDLVHLPGLWPFGSVGPLASTMSTHDW